MARSSLWNYLLLGALILSSLTFAMLLLSEQSYWMMRLFFAVAPVTIPLILLAPVFAVALVLSSLVKKELRWTTTWKITLWIFIFALSSFSFIGAAFTRYEVTTSASFENQKYYLIQFFYIDSYEYKLYSCTPHGLFCNSSSGYIGIPYQRQPIRLKYDLKTRKVYIQNADQTIPIPD
ncbi:hypothetical protein [Phormidesmis priestleyi]